MVLCPQCGPLVKKARRAERFSAKKARIDVFSQRTARSRRQTFDTFKQQTGPYEITIRTLHRAALSFALNPDGWLVLHGSKGTGKTHLANAITNHCEAEGTLIMSLTAPDLLDLLRSGYENNDYSQLLRITQTVEILILDDLGTESTTDWASEKLFQILNARYQDELPTVIITNRRPSELAPRIYDRISDAPFSVLVEALAPSYRQRETSPGKIVT